MPPEHHETQPSAEIARVAGAKCRRERVLSVSDATLCGDRARRGREMQVRLRSALSSANLCGDRAGAAVGMNHFNVELRGRHTAAEARLLILVLGAIH